MTIQKSANTQLIQQNVAKIKASIAKTIADLTRSMQESKIQMADIAILDTQVRSLQMKIKQLETQQQVAAQAPVATTSHAADDGAPNPWRTNLDYGERNER